MRLFKGFFNVNKYRLEILYLFFFFSSFSYAVDCSKIQFKITNSSLIYCVGQDVNLTTSLVNPEGATATYKWYYNNTAITPDVTTSSYIISKIDKPKAGKYKCEVILSKPSETPCTTSVEFDVVVLDQFSFDLGADKTMCPGTSSVELKPSIQNINSSIIYSWTSSPSGITGTSKDITVNATSIATESTLTLTASAGNCVFSDNLKISNVSNFTMSAGADQSICKGENANLSASVSNAFFYLIVGSSYFMQK